MEKDDKITLSLPDGSVRTGTITWENDKKSPRLKYIKCLLGNKFANEKSKAWAHGYISALQDINEPTYLTPISTEEFNYLYDFINGDAE